MSEIQNNHWADIYADRIIREKGDKEVYTCASGITPSGTVHIGNFREIISVELVVRALRARGKNVRFIYSWDDYDVFRKVPKNMPEQEKLNIITAEIKSIEQTEQGSFRAADLHTMTDNQYVFHTHPPPHKLFLKILL